VASRKVVVRCGLWAMRKLKIDWLKVVASRKTAISRSHMSTTQYIFNFSIFWSTK
jgi:hypothetical protein